MLTIKDLSAQKELDRKAMTAVRGGGDVHSTNVQSSSQSALGGLVGVNDSTQNMFAQNNAVDRRYVDVRKFDLDITKVAAGVGNVAI